METRYIIAAGVALLIAVSLILFLIHRHQNSKAKTTKETNSTGDKEGRTEDGNKAELLSTKVVVDSPEPCSSSSSCEKGFDCTDGVCSRTCSEECKPVSTVELGSPSCLDYWTSKERMETYVSKAPKFSETTKCESSHPQFELMGPKGETCQVTLSNTC